MSLMPATSRCGCPHATGSVDAALDGMSPFTGYAVTLINLDHPCEFPAYRAIVSINRHLTPFPIHSIP